MYNMRWCRISIVLLGDNRWTNENSWIINAERNIVDWSISLLQQLPQNRTLNTQIICYIVVLKVSNYVLHVLSNCFHLSTNSRREELSNYWNSTSTPSETHINFLPLSRLMLRRIRLKIQIFPIFLTTHSAYALFKCIEGLAWTQLSVLNPL